MFYYCVLLLLSSLSLSQLLSILLLSILLSCLAEKDWLRFLWILHWWPSNVTVQNSVFNRKDVRFKIIVGWYFDHFVVAICSLKLYLVDNLTISLQQREQYWKTWRISERNFEVTGAPPFNVSSSVLVDSSCLFLSIMNELTLYFRGICLLR